MSEVMELRRMHSPGARIGARPIPSLTGIRGVASLWVVLFHVGEGVPGMSLAPWLLDHPILHDGFRGVDLFFVLSGFIMMHVHMRDFAVLRIAELRRFFVIRIFRIYPVNFVVLLLILVAVLTLPDYVDWTRAWNSLFHLNAYTPASFVQTATLSQRWLFRDLGDWNGPSWSLSVELAAYLVFPFLARLLTRVQSANRCLLLAAASLAVMLILLLALGADNGNNVGRLGLLRGFGGFIAGAAMYRYAALTPGGVRWPGVAALISVGLIGVLPYGPRLAILAPFPFAVLVAALSYQTGVVDAVLRSRPVMFFGRISFSLYLVHLTPLQLAEWLFASGRLAFTPASVSIVLALYAVFVIGLSAVLHYWAERPCQRLGRALLRRMEATAGPAGLHGMADSPVAAGPDVS